MSQPTISALTLTEGTPIQDVIDWLSVRGYVGVAINDVQRGNLPRMLAVLVRSVVGPNENPKMVMVGETMMYDPKTMVLWVKS